jgi:hypothetical protein
MKLMPKSVQSNGSRWRSPFSVWRFEPLRNEPQLVAQLEHVRDE